MSAQNTGQGAARAINNGASASNLRDSTGVRPPAIPNRITQPPVLPRGNTRPSTVNSAGQGSVGENSSITRAKRVREGVQETSESNNFEQGDESSSPIRYRIGSLVSIILFFLGITLDGTELLLDVLGTFLGGVGVVIGYLKDAFVLLVLPSVFLLLGAPFWKGRKAKKKMVAMVTSFLVSLVPWLGAIMPETTISIMVTIYLTRKEDKEKAGVDTQNKVASAAITRLKRMKK